MMTDIIHKADLAIKKQQNAYADVLNALVAPDLPYAIVDVPTHSNSGDAAIYVGQLAYFKNRTGSAPSYVSDVSTYARDIESFVQEGPIFIHGGGNFGDMWGKHQELRFRLFEDFPDRQIVQLPQSVFFHDPKELDRTARAIEAHGGFQMIVRDIPSYEICSRHFSCPVHLAPDGAVNLYSLSSKSKPTHSFLSILRDDHEAMDETHHDRLKTLGPIRDWRGKSAPLSHFSWAIRKNLRNKLTSYPKRVVDDIPFRIEAYETLCAQRVSIAVELLGRARAIVSDRLHAHIISGLMRKPHVTLDNSYGKISNYMDAWGNDALALRATNAQELDTAIAHIKSGDPISAIEGRCLGDKPVHSEKSHLNPPNSDRNFNSQDMGKEHGRLN